MKRFIAICCLLVSPVLAHAAKQTINNGETMGQARTKINSNFTELYNDKSNVSCFADAAAFNTCFALDWITAAGLGLGTSDNPSFNSVHASGGNLAAANAQVTKKWITGLTYTADVTSVIHGGQHYIATSNHTAGASTEPGVGASWENVWKIASGTGGSDYTLPAATASVLGGVKQGQRVSIQADGTLSADEQYVSNCTGAPCLDGSSDGGSEIALFGGGTYWNKLQAGTLSASRTWKLPVAAAPAAGTTRLMNMDENGQMGFVDPATFAAANNVLALNNTTAFTPDADHEPATKKYVDDAIIAGGGYTDEMAQDAVGGMFTGNTETGIAITYDDATAKINAVVDFSGLASVYQPLDADLTTAAGANAASSSTYFGKNSGGTVGFHAFPTFNQNTTGSAASLSISGQTGLLTFSGLTSTNRAKTVRDAADTVLELGGSYTPTGTWNWQSATATWPTFNQNTTGTSAGLSGTPNITVGTVSAGGGGFTVDPDGDTVAKTIQAESFTSIAADGARRSVLPNNTVAMSPTGGGVVEIYNEAGAIKAVENNTEYDVLLSRDIGTSGGVQAYNQYLPTWPSTVDATEVGYLNGVTSAIQGQIDGKQATITFGTGVQTALGVNVGSAGAPVLFNGAGGTPTSLTLTNATLANSTSLPGTCTVGQVYIDTDADTDGSVYFCRATNTWKDIDDDGGAGGLASADIDTSSELRTIVTDESGTGALLFAGGDIGAATSTGAVDFGGATSFELPNGASPTVDATGEIAVDTTSDQLIYYGASAKRVITPKKQIDFVVKSPADADDFLLFKAQTAITITDIHVIAQGGTSISVDIQECNGTGGSCSTVDAAITADTDGAEDDGTLSNGTIDAGDWVKVVLGAPSGTVNFVSGSIYYVETAD